MIQEIFSQSQLNIKPFKPMRSKAKTRLVSITMGRVRKNQISKHKSESTRGFGITEMVLSVAAGSLLIAGGAIAMRSMGSAIQASSQINTLRNSSTTGLRLLRSETQRSIHLLVPGGTYESEQDFTDLNTAEHAEVIKGCQNLSMLAPIRSPFNPIFGMRMAELTTPVIYGLGTAKNSIGYSLLRCGPALSADGKYEVENAIISRALENIGTVPCLDGNCGNNSSSAEIISSLDNQLTDDNKTKTRIYPEPALAIETDTVRKLLKLIDPTDAGDSVEFSFLQAPGSPRDLRVNLNFTAYARADKINRTNSDFDENESNSSENNLANNQGLSGCTDNGGCTFYGIPVRSDKIQLIVDGSGSMSTCIAWGSSYGDTYRTFYDGSRYIQTRKICNLTRMESLQNELRALINSLSADTKISLEAFSSPGYNNHRSWRQGNLQELTADNRQKAIDFVNSLSSGSVTKWGGTRPWSALDRAFDNNDATAIFFMTDGKPNYDRNGGYWSSYDFEPTATYYINKNNSRDPNKLNANTVSVGQKSEWLQLISDGTEGIYKRIN